MTIDDIIAYAEQEMDTAYVNQTNLGRLADGEIFDDYERNEELPPEVYRDIMSAITK